MYACFGLLCGLTLKAEIMLRYYVMLAFAVTEKSFNVYRSQLCVHLDHIEPCLWMLEHEQRREQQHFNLLDEIIIYFAVVTGYLNVKLVLFFPAYFIRECVLNFERPCIQFTSLRIIP